MQFLLPRILTNLTATDLDEKTMQ